MPEDAGQIALSFAHVVKQAAEAVGRMVPAMTSALTWIVSAGLAGIVGVGVGAVVAPLTERVLVPAVAAVKQRLGAGRSATTR